MRSAMGVRLVCRYEPRPRTAARVIARDARCPTQDRRQGDFALHLQCQHRGWPIHPADGQLGEA
jgi:hypothetical protein